jgi:PKD repeat protein
MNIMKLTKKRISALLIIVLSLILFLSVPVSAVGNISISTIPAGTMVFLDGINTGLTTPTIIESVSSGQHIILLRLTGYHDYTRILTLSDNTTSTVSATLTPKIPIAQFTGTPTFGVSPLTVAFSDASTGIPTGWAWYFGDETYTEPWTLVNASAGWSPRQLHSSVAMPDGSIVLMGGDTSEDVKNDIWRSTDDGASWSLMNASAGWSARWGHTSVVLPDGSIVLMGGCTDFLLLNDVWRSTDDGASWSLMNASAGWSVRWGHTSVVLPDGSIVLMGGENPPNFRFNDVWRSKDSGATWTLMNASAGWSARTSPTSVAMPDGSIVLMGGSDFPNYMNDTWRSTDDGALWSLMNASAGWSARWGHASVTMPDNSIILMGGSGYSDFYDDTWRSTDSGTTWIQVNESSAWSARYTPSIVAMPDGSIVLMGGGDVTGVGDYFNDVWRLIPSGSSVQNPVHTYTTPGTYQVALQVNNADGYNSTLKSKYITVTGISDVGVFNSSTGSWYMDTTKAGVVNKTFQFGKSGDIPVVGDWDGNGISDAGVFRPLAGSWYMDTTKTGVVNKTFQFGKSGDIAVVGDWDGNGIPDAGVFRPLAGSWYMDTTKTGVVNKTFQFGKSGDIAVVGDWDGNGISDIGVFRESAGIWYIDYNNTGHVDKTFQFGKSGDIAVVGDWDGNGISDIGVFRPATGVWYLETTKTGVVNKSLQFGKSGDNPVIGDWDENGISDIGVFRQATGTWYLDTTKTGVVSSAFQFGKSGDIPVVGKWIYAPADSQGIISISPTFTYGNDFMMTIIGTNFQQDCTAKLTNNTNPNVVIEARDTRWDSSTQVTAWFTIPSPKQRGTYNVILTMPDGSVRNLQNGFEVR